MLILISVLLVPTVSPYIDIPYYMFSIPLFTYPVPRAVLTSGKLNYSVNRFSSPVRRYTAIDSSRPLPTV
jgi:hypothetical protein